MSVLGAEPQFLTVFELRPLVKLGHAPVRGRFGSRTSLGIWQKMQSWTIGVTKLKFQNSAYAVVQKHHWLKFNREYLQVQADGPLHPEENLWMNNIEVPDRKWRQRAW